MNLQDFSAQARPLLETALRQRIAAAFPGGDGLGEMLAYHMGWQGEGAGAEAQGKRIRPLLLLLCAAACGADWRAALPAAEAVELVHNFSLIHDDIEDASPLRHGRPTLWKLHGAALAINAGDALFSLAQAAVLDLEATLGAAPAVEAARVLARTCQRLTHGQHLDITFEDRREISMPEHKRMVDGKTAALLEAWADLGGLAGGASPELRAALCRFGRGLGLAFQAQDDYLGIWGESERTGKSTESDLVAGKKSLPVVYALAQNGAFARRWRQAPVTPADVPAVTALLEEAGAHRYTQEAAARLTHAALEALEAATPSGGEAAAALKALADMLLARQA
jgi:geranylgeranyl diphosphate synthase type I